MGHQTKEGKSTQKGTLNFTSFFKYLYSPHSSKSLRSNASAGAVNLGNSTNKSGTDLRDIDKAKNSVNATQGGKGPISGVQKFFLSQTRSRSAKRSSSASSTETIAATCIAKPRALPSLASIMSGFPSSRSTSAAESPDILCLPTGRSESSFMSSRPDSPSISVTSSNSIADSHPAPYKSSSLAPDLSSPSITKIKSAPISPEFELHYGTSSPKVSSPTCYSAPSVDSEYLSPSSVVKSVRKTSETYEAFIRSQSMSDVPELGCARKTTPKLQTRSTTWANDAGYVHAKPGSQSHSRALSRCVWVSKTTSSNVGPEHESPTPSSRCSAELVSSPPASKCARTSQPNSSRSNSLNLVNQPPQSKSKCSNVVHISPECDSPNSVSDRCPEPITSPPPPKSVRTRRTNSLRSNSVDLANQPPPSESSSHRYSALDVTPSGGRSFFPLKNGWLPAHDRPESNAKPHCSASDDVRLQECELVWHGSSSSRPSLHESHNETSGCDKGGVQHSWPTQNKLSRFRRKSFGSSGDFLNGARKTSAKGLDSTGSDQIPESIKCPKVLGTTTVPTAHIHKPEELGEIWQLKRASRLTELEPQPRQNMVNSSVSASSCTWDRRYRERKEKCNGGSLASVSVQTTSISECSKRATGLPPAMWQRVFSFLPRQQILGCLRVVCRGWQAVIDDSSFLPHLKKYQILDSVRNKSLFAQSAKRVETWLSESQLTTITGLLNHLRRGPFTTSPVALSSSLQLHYHAAQHNDSDTIDCWSNCIMTLDMLKEFEDESWCLALLLILFVSDGPLLQELLKILLSGKAGASHVEAVEFIYLSLTALTAGCWEDGREPLCDLERAIKYTEFAEGRRSLEGQCFCFTAEQQEILGTELLPDEIMVVKAFPGTGKSRTLLEYANRRPRRRFAYVIFDQCVITEGETTFPPNTKCINFQKLAYVKMGWLYRHKLCSNNLSPLSVKIALGVSSHAAVYFILLTLEQFLQSPDMTIKECHVPKKAVMSGSQDRSLEVCYYLEKAENLWQMMIDKGSRDISMTDNGYLKLYQLSEPQLDYQYDCLLCDEVQNATPAMIDIVLRQTGCSKILVGDPHQQIHGFGDAENDIQRAMADSEIKRLNLTLSFRFSPKIASTCNSLLQLKDEKTAMIGVKPMPEKSVTSIGNLWPDLTFTIRERGGQKWQAVVIARTNARVFEVALQYGRRRLGFVGGIGGFRFDLICDTWHLMKGNHLRIQDRYIRSFSSYIHMIEFAQQTGDLELLTRIKIVECHQVDLPKKIEAVRDMDVGADLATAQVLFSTAHKAKGLKFDVVALANDFAELSPLTSVGGKFFVDDDTLQEGMREELNLVYVAASRAESCLILNADVDNYVYLHAAGLRGEPRPLLMFVKNTMTCISCLKPWKSRLGIVAGRLSDSDNDPTLPDFLFGGSSSSSGHTRKSNEKKPNQSWRVYVCLDCAKQQRTVPLNLLAGVKMIASALSSCGM